MMYLKVLLPQLLSMKKKILGLMFFLFFLRDPDI